MNDELKEEKNIAEAKRFELSPEERQSLFGENQEEMTKRLLSYATLTTLAGDQKDIDITVQMMNSLSPSNGLEKMLVAQLICINNLQLKCAAYFSDTKTCSIEKFKVLGSMAVKLSNVFVQQAQLLSKLQGKDHPQNVTVGDVNVHAGGQAIVGSVTNNKE